MFFEYVQIYAHGWRKVIEYYRHRSKTIPKLLQFCEWKNYLSFAGSNLASTLKPCFPFREHLPYQRCLGPSLCLCDKNILFFP